MGPWSLGVRDWGAQPGGADGKHILTSDFFPSFLPPYHVENSSIAGSRQLPGRAACSGSRGARAGCVKRLPWRAAPRRQRGADSDVALVVSFFLNRIQMFWPRGKIEVFLFSSSPSGLKFLVLLIFKPLLLSY